MAKKMNGNGNGNAVRTATARAGFKPVEAPRSEFWTPHDPESEHPTLLECAVLGRRTLPAHGKFQSQEVLDVSTADGSYYTVPLKGDLGRKVKVAALEEGQAIVIEWLGFEPSSPALPMGMNRYSLLVEG